MNSLEKILLFFALISGLTTKFCKANVLISSRIPEEKLYGMDLEIFKHIDRYHSVFKRAEIWEIFEEMSVKSAFNFFVDDDNVNEFKNYMKFIQTSGLFFKNLTLSYSILYTKYTAAFYAVNLLNIYKIKKKAFASWDTDESISEILKNYKPRLLNIYLKMSQYFAWYAYIGNDVLQKVVLEILSRKIPCAVDEYTIFTKSFNGFLTKLDEKIFNSESIKFNILNNEDIDLKKFWQSIYHDTIKDVTIINRYFTALFFGTPERNEITESLFLSTFQKETFIANFVSDLSTMKGRDIEETYPNFDYRDKKEIYEANIVNVMAVIENNEMKSVPKASEELKRAQQNYQYVVLQRSNLDEIQICVVFEIKNHETILKPKKAIPSTGE